MNPRKAFDQGIVAGVFLMLAANAVYWLISSWSSEINSARTTLVILQLIVGIGVAGYFLFRRTQYSKVA
ncbi:MAG: hypothetical protein C3F13_06635 [Anaerolineales bacterium]|nr:MAG: hypothetical protein C3F13_06635 [Anaerolineales bacterium]